MSATTAAAILTPTPTAASQYEDVKEFARGCMRSYLVFKDKAAQFNADAEVQALLAEINADDGSYAYLADGYSSAAADRLQSTDFDRAGMGERNLPYERLDQLTFDILLGVRYQSRVRELKQACVWRPRQARQTSHPSPVHY